MMDAAHCIWFSSAARSNECKHNGMYVLIYQSHWLNCCL